MSRNKQVSQFLVIGFLIIIFGVGLTQAGLELAQGETPYVLSLFTQEPTSYNLRIFEKELESSNWFSQQLQPVMRSLQFLILQDTGDKALLGRDEWFFYRQDVTYLVEPWPVESETFEPDQDPVRAITSFRDQLMAQGIQLLVMPVPGKPSIYPEKLTARAESSSEPVSHHTKNVIRQLKDQGIQVIDLYDLFSLNSESTSGSNETFYLTQDTHWSPEGMQRAASAAARKVLHECGIEKGQVSYTLKPIPLRRYGDVIRMMNIPIVNQLYNQEALICSQVVCEESGELYKGKDDSLILVMGDSFLRIFELDEPKSAGFVSHLAYELKMPVSSIIADGGASTLVRQELVRKPALLQNKKVVIWEFVERDIRFGTEGWMDIKLPLKQEEKDS